MNGESREIEREVPVQNPAFADQQVARITTEGQNPIDRSYWVVPADCCCCELSRCVEERVDDEIVVEPQGQTYAQNHREHDQALYAGDKRLFNLAYEL